MSRLIFSEKKNRMSATNFAWHFKCWTFTCHKIWINPFYVLLLCENKMLCDCLDPGPHYLSSGLDQHCLPKPVSEPIVCFWSLLTNRRMSVAVATLPPPSHPPPPPPSPTTHTHTHTHPFLFRHNIENHVFFVFTKSWLPGQHSSRLYHDLLLKSFNDHFHHLNDLNTFKRPSSSSSSIDIYML